MYKAGTRVLVVNNDNTEYKGTVVEGFMPQPMNERAPKIMVQPEGEGFARMVDQMSVIECNKKEY